MRALSGDGELLDQLLAHSFAARVHSVFEHALNIQHGDGLFTLATAASDDSPRTLVIAANSFVAFSLMSASRVTVTGSRLSVGRLVVDLGRVRRWHPVLPAWSAQPDLVRDLERLIDAEGTRGGIRANRVPAHDAEALSASVLSRTTGAFVLALGVGDLGAAQRHGTRLVGLGGGLTPAGDDYLVGMCTAFGLPGAGWQSHRQLLTRIIENNIGRTNDISRAALRQASRGRVRESIIELARSLVTSDGSALPDRVRRVLAIGHTSGTDIATGLLGGLQLRLRSATHDGLPERRP